MQTRKTIIAAALVWMAGLLGIILFQDVFAGSLLGAVLGILMVIVTLAATYFMVDGMLMLKQQSEEQQDLLQRAYQDKLLEENIIMIKGRLSIREDDNTKIVAQEIRNY